MLNNRLKPYILNDRRTSIFSHPDFTVGFGIAPNPALRLAGLEKHPHHRRSGISPSPEDRSIFLQIYYTLNTELCEEKCLYILLDKAVFVTLLKTA
ncbi:hypothetical protein NEOCIP111885_02038 [Pseudoneobacillus rhizosphaerae]|uniref:Uncharacterized protein n=1 Tax=Pseudoneobacillus rhizosphaerae TaxID=2880968 RepID=A0A9C7G995_9BACI|nr:hypothetical protein NEOCIP111885_02038 [Pseudoneobacillus rhizosphaerae]